MRRTFAALPIIVCDASRQPLFTGGTRLGRRLSWRTVPTGRGHAVGLARNHALAQVRTPFFFLCDDDHVVGSFTDLRRMVEFLRRRCYDIAGGCQGKDDYGAATFCLRDGVLRQNFFCHRGIVEPGAVCCDRVSNTFVGRTDRVRAVGWEERVHGDEHAEFFWRAQQAGLRVAQLRDTYVLHARDPERPSSLWRALLRPWLAHADGHYVLARRGGSKQRAHEAYLRHCLQKNGLRAMVSRTRWRDKWRFLRSIKR